eukprot:EG_transcript_39004
MALARRLAQEHSPRGTGPSAMRQGQALTEPLNMPNVQPIGTSQSAGTDWLVASRYQPMYREAGTTGAEAFLGPGERGFSGKHCTALQYSTARHSTVQCSAVQCSAVQYNTVQYSTAQHSTVQYSTVQYSAVQYSAVGRTRNRHE